VDLVSWIAAQQGISCILHYLDNFLLVGPPQSPTCQQNRTWRPSFIFVLILVSPRLPKKLKALIPNFPS